MGTSTVNGQTGVPPFSTHLRDGMVGGADIATGRGETDICGITGVSSHWSGIVAVCHYW